jgi:hypothetical protein
VLGEPNGRTACLNDAPCPPFSSHGASIRRPFGAGLAGVPLPAGRVFDGRDLMPLLLDKQGMVTSPHKCIYYWKGCTDNKLCGVRH